MTPDSSFDPSALHCVLDARASLGECPVWSRAEQALFWVDINAPSLNRFDPTTGTNRAMPMPSSIGCFALRRRGGFVVALRDGIWLADQRGALERKVADAPYETAHHRFNDGRCDARGRFFVGTMNEQRDAPSASLYRLDADGRLAAVIGGLTISNGLAWSPDGKTMYHADTPTLTVNAYSFDESAGTPSGRRVFARFAGATDRPDGAAVDRDGCYWSAFYGGGRVVRLSTGGEVLSTHSLPAMCPTMCAFGGSDLQTLYVTSARQRRDDAELSRLPASGGVFAMRVEVPGLPEPAFAG
jgi:sugar lactone lactonase YvrE